MFPSSIPDDEEPDDRTTPFWKRAVNGGAHGGSARPGSMDKEGCLWPFIKAAST